MTLLRVIPTMTYHGEDHIDTSHSLCKQAIAFFWVCDVASRSAASLPNVTWRLTDMITWMDHQTFQTMSLYRVQFRLQNKHAKTCWSPPKSLMSCRLQCSLKNKHAKTCQDMLETTWITHVMSAAAQLGKQTCQDTVGNHLNQSWNVTCRWGWTTNMPRHAGPPPDSRPIETKPEPWPAHKSRWRLRWGTPWKKTLLKFPCHNQHISMLLKQHLWSTFARCLRRQCENATTSKREACDGICIRVCLTVITMWCDAMIPIVVVSVPQYLPRFLKPNRKNIVAAKGCIIFPQNCIKTLFELIATSPQRRTGRNHTLMRICPENRSASARVFAYLATIVIHLLARAPHHLLRFFRILHSHCHVGRFHTPWSPPTAPQSAPECN